MRDWVGAWYEALYGPDGFYRRPEGPAGHFRTASHADAPALAAALSTLARRHGCTTLIDVGAGRGELLTALAHPLVRDHALSDASALRLHGVDVVPRPASLPETVGWSEGLDRLPPETFAGALVVAWELLDVVPAAVLELDDDGEPRVVTVEPRTGRETFGGPPNVADLAWCERWWPLEALEPGDRVEVGRHRDALWASLVTRLADAGGGVLLAVDYAHTRDTRPPAGSLTGFARGRAVPPRADGGTDITAHVALDAVEAAGRSAGASPGTFLRQDEALRDLGVTSPELVNPGSLGGFTWLLQPVPPVR